MPLFPLFLRIEGCRCVVVGGGRVGRAKARSLRGAGARVIVLDPSPGEALVADAEGDPDLILERRRFEAGDCDGARLVFACTDNADVQEAVSKAAAAAGVLVCRADDGSLGDFSSGALLRRGPVTIAVSTGGRDPRLAVAVRDRLAALLGRAGEGSLAHEGAGDGPLMDEPGVDAGAVDALSGKEDRSCTR